MSSADFYVGLGDTAEWLGTLAVDGGTADMDDAGLFGPAANGHDYTEDTYRTIVWDLLAEARAEDYGYAASEGDRWPWPHPDSSGTDMVYAYNNGSVHVFEKGDGGRSGQPGQYLVALHYPNGARKPSRFPDMGAAA